MKLCILGFGAVGRGVIKVLSMKKELLMDKYGLEIDVVAVTDSSGAAINSDGLDLQLLIETKENTNKISEYPNYGVPDVSSAEFVEVVEFDCLVEVTPTNIDHGEPAKTHMLNTLIKGKDVVTSNKGPLSLFFSELVETANSNNAQFKYEASVGGAMPIINFAHDNLA